MEITEEFFTENIQDKIILDDYCIDFPRDGSLIAIGDIQGKYRVLIECLHLAGIITDLENPNWNPKKINTYLVQTGDELDRF